jgi:hypothetical protein
MSALCRDCGMDTEPWPPHRGTQEQYIVKDHVWQQARMPPGSMTEDLAITGGGFLCVGCIERRLGRLLTIDDFSPITHRLLKGCQNTPRLLSRTGVDPMTVANTPLPDHIVDQWLETTLANALRDHRPPGMPRVHKVEVDGDEVVLVHKKEAFRYRAGPKLMALREAMRWDRAEEIPDGGIDLLAWEEEAGHYEPSNCRWSDAKTQTNNRRRAVTS